MTDTAANQTVSLNDIGLRYLSGIQRMSDLVVYSWTGARTVSEQGYDEVFKSIPGLPSTEFRTPFNVIQEETESWWLRHSLNELLGLVVHFLEEVRKLSGLVTFNAARAKGDADLAALAAELNTPMVEQAIPGRFQHLRERFSVASPLEGDLLSFTQLAQILFQNGGVIPEGQTFTLKVKRLEPATGEGQQPKMGNFDRTWKGGEKISLSRAEHAALFTTVSLLIGSLLTAVQEYAQKAGLPAAPAAAQ